MIVMFVCNYRPATYTRSYLNTWNTGPNAYRDKLRAVGGDMSRLFESDGVEDIEINEDSEQPLRNGSAMEGIWLEACEKPEQYLVPTGGRPTQVTP